MTAGKQRSMQRKRRQSDEGQHDSAMGSPATHIHHNAARSTSWLSRAAVVLFAGSIAIAWHPMWTPMSSRPTPRGPHEECRLHYARFHLLWTIPETAALYVIAAPFLTSLDHAKLVLLPIIAFVWTTPWDNELVRQGAWWYPHTCVLGRVGYVPLEEYFFFLIQSIMTSLFTILLTRWITPRSLAPRPLHHTAQMLPAIPVLCMLTGLVNLTSKDGFGQRYYLSMIAWWASTPLVLLWWGTRYSWTDILASRIQQILWGGSLLLPTFYLCISDLFALRRGTWHISERKSLHILVSGDLPIEEAIFFFATNLILVSACFTFDRVVWQCRTRVITDRQDEYAPMSPSNFRLSWQSVPSIWRHFVTLDAPNKEYTAPASKQAAMDASMQILAQASKSFHAASMLLPWDLRTDLGYIYAFARAMDDFVDDVAVPRQQRKRAGRRSTTDSPQRRLDMLHDLVAVAFSSNSSVSPTQIAKKISAILASYSDLFISEQDTAYHRSALETSALAASFLRVIVPVHLWEELLQGYATDSSPHGPQFHSFVDQANYAQDVAGSIGEICVRIILARSGILVEKGYRAVRDTEHEGLVRFDRGEPCSTNVPSLVFTHDQQVSLSPQRAAHILRDARRMGVALQMVNIARDIADDGRQLHRCYLVLDENSNALREELQRGHIATSMSSDTRRVSLQSIYKEKVALLKTARAIYKSSVGALAYIPSRPAQSGLRAACMVYMGIGDAIERDGVKGAGGRSRASQVRRILLALRAVYIGY